MAKVTVSRQVTDEENQIQWIEQEIEEEDLLPGEFPLPVFPTWIIPGSVEQ